MKYKVGDKVRVRTGLKVGIRYSRRAFNEQMDHWSGRVVTIKKIAKEGRIINPSEDRVPDSYRFKVV